MPAQEPQPGAIVKMVEVDAKFLAAVGYVSATRTLYVKFQNTDPMLCFKDVPNFRYSGLLNAPRKDAYYITYIKNSFLSKPAPPTSVG